MVKFQLVCGADISFQIKTKQNRRTTGTISEWRQMPNVLRVKAVALGIFFLPWSSLKCNVQVFIRGCFTWVCKYLCSFLVAVRAGDKLNVVAGSDRKTLSVGSDGPQFFFFASEMEGQGHNSWVLQEHLPLEKCPLSTLWIFFVGCYFKSMDGKRKEKTKRGVKLQIGARLHSQTQSRISIHLKSFFPATWQMKVQYSLSFLPSFWSAEDPEGNNVADESHTVFCR